MHVFLLSISPEEDRDIAFQFIIRTEKMNLSNNAKIKNLRQLLSKVTLKSLSSLGKFIQPVLYEGESIAET